MTIDLEKYKKKLEGQRDLLAGEIKALEVPPDFGDFPGEDDETDEGEEKYNQKSAVDSLKERLSDIEVALIKINNNSYGVCKECGKEIEAEVLDVVPESELCRDCKKKNI